MKTYSVYDPETGLFTGQVISGSAHALSANTPLGMLTVEGRHDRICQKVDLKTLSVVEHQPPQPNEDYEWRAENPDSANRAGQRWRWIKKAAIVEAEQRRAVTLSRIADLEKRQLRVMRELAIDPTVVGSDGKTPIERLKAIDAQIAAIRD